MQYLGAHPPSSAGGPRTSRSRAAVSTPTSWRRYVGRGVDVGLRVGSVLGEPAAARTSIVVGGRVGGHPHRIGEVEHGWCAATEMSDPGAPPDPSSARASRGRLRRTGRSHRAGARSRATPTPSRPGAKKCADVAAPRTQVGLQRGQEEVVGADGPAAVAPELDRAAEHREHTRSSPRRVGVDDAADGRSAVADRRVRDVAHGLAQQRNRLSRGGIPAPGRRDGPAHRLRTPVGRPRFVETGNRLMSIRAAGAANRMLSSGSRLWPPGEHLAAVGDVASTDGLVDSAGRRCVDAGRLHRGGVPVSHRGRRRSSSLPRGPQRTRAVVASVSAVSPVGGSSVHRAGWSYTSIRAGPSQVRRSHRPARW